MSGNGDETGTIRRGGRKRAGSHWIDDAVAVATRGVLHCTSSASAPGDLVAGSVDPTRIDTSTARHGELAAAVRGTTTESSLSLWNMVFSFLVYAKIVSILFSFIL